MPEFYTPKYKARFEAVGHYHPPSDAERNEICASIDRLKGLLPSSINPEDHPTILYVVGNLAVGGVCNLNDDAVSLEDTLRVYPKFEGQLVDIEHNRGVIVGYIVKAGLSEIGTDRLLTVDEAREANKPCNIAIAMAIWKVADKDLCNFIIQSAAPGSRDKGRLSLSFEVGFDDYDVVVLPKGKSDLALATKLITPDSGDWEKWDKTLRCNGGKGAIASTGERVARVLRGEIVPLGAGIVAVPAAAVKGIAPVLSNPNFVHPLADVLDAGLYSRSSTQFTLSSADAARYLEFAASIPEDDLYYGEGEGAGKYGRETESHATVLYGIKTADAAPIQTALADMGPATITMGEVSAFERDDAPYDVLKVTVEGQDIHTLHHLLRTSTDNDYAWLDFQPHLTLCYTKKGRAAQYVGDKRFMGHAMTFNSLSFRPHTGDPVEIPLRQTSAEQVYTPTADIPMSTTSSCFLKLTPEWQNALANIQLPNNGSAPLVNGVDVTLSDGTKLTNVKIFDGATLQLEKELAMPPHVTITSMTPGMPPQTDDTKLVHPRIGDQYPTVRPEAALKQDANNALNDKGRNAPYTDNAIKAALDDVFARLAAIFASAAGRALMPTLTNTATAGVSVSTPNPTVSPTMNLDDIKQTIASVKTVEELPTAMANVALFTEEIAKASEKFAKERADAVAAQATTQAALEDMQRQFAALKKSHDEAVAAQQAAAAEAQFNERMATVEANFAFDDETRAEVIDEIKACADDAAFAKWLARAKKLYKGWSKAAFPDKGGEKLGDKKNDKEPDDDADDKACKAAAQQALASAQANPTDAPVVNDLGDAARGQSLKDKYMEAFAQVASIGGTKVADLAEAAKKSTRKTR